jgi:thioredoxin-dependent peroxiredoxin
MPAATSPPRVGDPAPPFSLPDQHNALRTLDEFKGRPVVLFFFPKAFTPACTAEACSFRDQYEVFSDHGAAVIGISSDSAETQASFAGRHNLPFTLLSDADSKVRNAYAVPKTLGLFPGRMSFVLDHHGTIRHTFNSQLRAQAHINKALEFLRALTRAK